MNKTFTDIAINLTNKQFPNDIESIIQNAIDTQVSKMILTGTSIRNSE
jgi:TatD DNase family protein